MGKVVDLLFDRQCTKEDIPAALRELADEWEKNPPGTGMLAVIVSKHTDYPQVLGYGDFGHAMIELELARMLLFKYYLGRNR